MILELDGSVENGGAVVCGVKSFNFREIFQIQTHSNLKVP